MTNRTKYFVLFAVGIAFCVIPPAMAVYAYFPLWKSASPAVMASGVMVSVASILLMACVAIPPLAKWLKLLVKKTPSAWVGFLIVTVILYAISLVIRQLYIIFAVATLGNLCGQVFFFSANRYKKGD